MCLLSATLAIVIRQLSHARTKHYEMCRYALFNYLFKYYLSLKDTVADNIERNNSNISFTTCNQMKWAFVKVNFKVSQLHTWQKPQAKYNTVEENVVSSTGPTIKHCADCAKIINGRNLKNGSSFLFYIFTLIFLPVKFLCPVR
jgi:hypothetical protein